MSDAFDLLDRPLHWISVKWPGLKAAEDEASLSVPIEHEVELRVELVDKDEAIAMFPGMFEKDHDPQLAEIPLFMRLVKGWRKIKLGGRVPDLTEENVKRLLKVPMFGASFANTYIAALGGRIAIREGNSESLPSGGQADDLKAAGERTNSTGIARVSE